MYYNPILKSMEVKKLPDWLLDKNSRMEFVDALRKTRNLSLSSRIIHGSRSAAIAFVRRLGGVDKAIEILSKIEIKSKEKRPRKVAKEIAESRTKTLREYKSRQKGHHDNATSEQLDAVKSLSSYKTPIKENVAEIIIVIADNKVSLIPGLSVNRSRASAVKKDGAIDPSAPLVEMIRFTYNKYGPHHTAQLNRDSLGSLCGELETPDSEILKSLKKAKIKRLQVVVWNWGKAHSIIDRKI